VVAGGDGNGRSGAVPEFACSGMTSGSACDDDCAGGGSRGNVAHADGQSSDNASTQIAAKGG